MRRYLESLRPADVPAIHSVLDWILLVWVDRVQFRWQQPFRFIPCLVDRELGWWQFLPQSVQSWQSGVDRLTILGQTRQNVSP